MQDPTDNRDVAIAPDPLDQLVKRVRVGEDVVGGLPIGVLVGIAKARHSERRAVSKRSAEVRRSGACKDCRLKSVNVIRRILAEQILGKRHVA
jgi:antitoxin (DNA-binding transcriptional repressor) of toxin-antitoxin stability system